MPLRPYQSEAVAAAQDWMRASIEPCLIEAPTGAGKSHIVAALAEWLHGVSSGKRVLCLAPQKELTLQNAAKMRAAGESCSIFSASAGIKSTRHKIVFATPLTVKNSLSRFLKDYCAVVLDEAHTLSPTVLAIIEAMRQANPNLRVVGLTATPFRLGKGYIFRMHSNDRVNNDENCRDPFFQKLVYQIDARTLIEQGYLTPPFIGAINSTGYDTGGLILQPNGKFTSDSVDAAFVGYGRKTAAIVADVISQSRDRRGVVFFASTVRHAEEIMASLPQGMSAMVTGETKDRARVLQRFEQQEVKYIVNVGVLTTGWDCSHVDVIALLRRTESVGLLQQMIGRGLRLHEGKRDCMILDYASNLNTHTPDGDLFAPVIKAHVGKNDGAMLEACCPDCGTINEFKVHKDYADYKTDKHGYCLDVFGEVLMSEHGPVPGHYGRRCFGEVLVPGGTYERCGYRWNGKECPSCGEQNDIAARYCYVCKAEIVDPNEKLAADFKALKRDPHRLQTDRVLEMHAKEGVSRAGNPTLRVDWVTPYRQFSTWFQPSGTHSRAIAEMQRFKNATQHGKPETISYAKDRDSGFFRIVAYNQMEDLEPEKVSA